MTSANPYVQFGSDLRPSGLRAGRSYPSDGSWQAWQRGQLRRGGAAHDAELKKDGLGAGNDAFVNAAARTGFSTPSVAEGADYTLVRWSYDYQLMYTLYRNQWVARRIVDTPAQDMIRAWPKINSEIEPDDLTQLDRVIRQTQTKQQMLDALKWARLFGGAGALIVIDGHENRLDEPLDLDTVELGAYKGLIPFDRWVGIYPDTHISNDISKPLEFNLPQHYRVQSIGGGQGYQVHSSRILRFTGPSVPAPEYQAQMYWGISVLEIVYEAMKMRDNMLWNMLNMSFRANILAMENDQLSQALSGVGMNQQALVAFYQRMEAMNQMLSNQNMLVLPKDGDLKSTQYAFGGLGELLEQFRYEVSGASEIPEMRLFGHSPSGLGIKDDPAERLYEEKIALEQDDKLRPQLDKLYPVICMSTLGEVPDDLELHFPSIRIATEEERSTLATSITGAITTVFGAGLIKRKTALQELKQSSDSTGMWSNITDEDIQAAEDDDAADKELKEAQQEAMLAGGGFPPEQGEEGGGPEASEPEEPQPAIAKDASSNRKLRNITFAGLPITVEHDAGEPSADSERSERAGLQPADELRLWVHP